MDDMWLFDNEQKTLVSDFLNIQALLSDRGLSINDKKSEILEDYDPEAESPSDLDEMKIRLLRKRRTELRDSTWDPSEEDAEESPEDLTELNEEELEYLMSLLQRESVQEEDAELVLTLMRDHSADLLEYMPLLIREFPGLAKRLYHFCVAVQDKESIISVICEYLETAMQVTEYQLFWFGKMAEDYLLSVSGVDRLLIALYEHTNATDISKAKILEIPEKRFGLPDLQEEQLRTGHSGWLAWTAAVGWRGHSKGQRNQMLKYFRKASSMNRLIGDFVETCFWSRAACAAGGRPPLALTRAHH